MFGMNSIEGKKMFNKENEVSPGKLLVTSIFYTFQGEGPFTGRPAVFVRLAKCNLACSFCDAYFDQGDWMTPAEIMAKAVESVKSVIGPSRGDVVQFMRLKTGIVVTGGEPMLQDNLSDFFQHIQHKFAWMQVETNGTQSLKDLHSTVKVVVSPKCAEKNGVATQYLKPHASVADRATALKFVVTADANSPYHDIPDWAKAMAGRLPIYVSPMNVYLRLPAKAVAMKLIINGVEQKPGLKERSTTDEVVSFWDNGLLDNKKNRENHEYAARLAVERGYLFNLQQHLYASMA
jgi:organic radical activating enzyme